MEELIKEEAKQEEVKADVETTNEEKQPKTFTQEEVDKLLAETKKNAIAEGMRKASKQQQTQTNDELENLKASLNEKDTLIAEKQNQMDDLTKELTAIKQVNKMNELGIDRQYQEDLIAIIKGKGEELNEETITAYAEKHPEWQVEKEIGIASLGQTKQSQNPYDEARAKKEKEIDALFRL